MKNNNIMQILAGFAIGVIPDSSVWSLVPNRVYLMHMHFRDILFSVHLSLKNTMQVRDQAFAYTAGK